VRAFGELSVSGEATDIALRALDAAQAQAGTVDLSWLQPPPPPDGWTLSPDALRLLTALVRELRPRHALELGSGLSTRVLARACANLKPGCAVSSVDHDPEFGARTRAAWEAEKPAGSRIRFQIAPVVVRDCGGELLPVYALQAARLASRRPADLVLIDGPPELLGGREGTLYQVMDLSRAGTIVLLDDAARPREQDALRHWQENLGEAIEVRLLPGFAKGLAAIIIRNPVRRRELWDYRAELTARELAASVPAGAPVVLLDENNWGARMLPGRTVFPFVERAGEYWGPPETDEAGIGNLEDLRRRGARFLAIVWPAFWWLAHYAGLARHVCERYRCVLENERLKVYAL
jgi:predicted O-methyltransferase YrrM